MPTVLDKIDFRTQEPECSADITAAMEDCLAGESQCLNSRLYSEEKIAANLSVSVRDVRTSLNTLADKGYLLRKRGSGTFVRQLPQASRKNPLAGKNRFSLALNQLMDHPRTRSISRGSRLKRMPKNAQWLQLGLWTDLYDHGNPHPFLEVNQAMLQRANTLGHHLAIQSFTDENGEELPMEQLIEGLERQPYDGFIVESRSRYFAEAAAPFAKHIVCYQTATHPINCEPMVAFNTMEATERAIHILVDQKGYHKIGLFVPDVHLKVDHGRFDLRAYDAELAERGISYRAVSRGRAFTNGNALDAAIALLSRSDPPQAVYVADDHLLPAFLEASRRCNRTIGQDLFVITLSNKGIPLPPGYNWSRMEFDPRLIGEAAVNILVKSILEEEDFSPVQSFHAHWREGNTHG